MSIPGNPYKQIGLVSFGSDEGCELGDPIGFTELTYHLDWISAKTGLNLS
jgi:secreted trypsin-like serine protease